MTSHCEKCCTRFDACAECTNETIKANYAEIAALKKRVRDLEGLKATYGHEWDKDGNYKPHWITWGLHQETIEKLKNCHNCKKQETCTLISRKCKDWEPQQ